MRPPIAAAGEKSLSSAQTCAVILGALEDSKAQETISIDISKKSSLGDTMIITSGRSHRHVASIAEFIVSSLKKAKVDNIRMEGHPHCDWVLVDIGDVIVHIFRPEVRAFYNLEKMWSTQAPAQQPASRPVV